MILTPHSLHQVFTRSAGVFSQNVGRIIDHSVLSQDTQQQCYGWCLLSAAVSVNRCNDCDNRCDSYKLDTRWRPGGSAELSERNGDWVSGRPGEPGGAALSGARERAQPWNSREDARLIWGGNEPIRWENDPGADWWDSEATLKSKANRMGTGDWLDVKPEAATTDGMRSSDFGERSKSEVCAPPPRSDVCISAAQGCQTLHNAHTIPFLFHCK